MPADSVAPAASEAPEPVLLEADTWQEQLAAVCQSVIARQGQAMLCVTGKSGSGKSTLGKALRKRGLPGLPPRHLAVIDDGVLSVPLFGIFNRRIKSRSRERDELEPFRRFVRRKKLVVYVNSKPHLRLSQCDIALRLRCPEEERERRLRRRDYDGAERFRRTLKVTDEIGIAAHHVFDLCLQPQHARGPLAKAGKALLTSQALWVQGLIELQPGLRLADWC